jgi:hypothetical protein
MPPEAMHLKSSLITKQLLHLATLPQVIFQKSVGCYNTLSSFSSFSLLAAIQPNLPPSSAAIHLCLVNHFRPSSLPLAILALQLLLHLLCHAT